MGEHAETLSVPTPVLPAAGPAAQAERIVPLDVLRGFALLGILVMNIQSFAMIDAAYMNPTAYGDLTGANYAVWLLSHVLADQKFMTIFSMLFGAGILLMTGRQEAATGRSARIHYRRMGVLLVFGLLHAYLLWYGDILYTYALCGMVVYPLRKLAPGRLLGLGLLAIGVASGVSLCYGWATPFWPPEQWEAFVQEAWRPTPAMIAAEVAAYRSGWIGEIAHRAPTAFWFQTALFLIWGVWRAGGLMLVGMAFFKWGIFNATRSPRTYRTMIVVGLGLGIPLIVYGVQQNFAAGWDARYSFFFGGEYNYWGSLLVSLGWVGLVMRGCQHPHLAPLTRPLAAVGQMALTNYLLHTLICTTIFYGHGFGLFGQVERTGQIGIVFVIWAFQLLISPLWLRYFRFGPAEWLWRSLTYGRRQPMWRGSEAGL